jgi:hypothetical protein
VRQPLRREPPQLIVNLRQVLARGLTVAPRHGVQDLRDVSHDASTLAVEGRLATRDSHAW